MVRGKKKEKGVIRLEFDSDNLTALSLNLALQGSRRAIFRLK